MRFLKHNVICGVTLLACAVGGLCTASERRDTLNVLFIGNSYTARHNLAQVVQAMAESRGDAKLNVSTVIYGGRRLADHWRLGSQNYLKLSALTAEEERATIATLQRMIIDDPDDSHAKRALQRHQMLLEDLESQRTQWDVVVLQSYRDDLEGRESLYAQYAPKFAKLAQANGSRVVLYETTPTTQNAEPLAVVPDQALVMKKAQAIATLANQVDAQVAPMSLVALRCQTERPDLTLRFINDAHLNHTMAYLTACTIYAAIFDRNPEGLEVDSITDIRFFHDGDRSKDRDGKPITRTFSTKDRSDLQRIAWQGYRAGLRLKQRAALKEEGRSPSARTPAPSKADVRYGAHERQVLDFYRAESETPTPLLFYIHGGGWVAGDKQKVSHLADYLAAGISVVSINYRYSTQAQQAGVKPPVKWPLNDAARALQFVRSKAGEWNIAKARIAATGGSAGACTSLWLAFHDDLADPTSADPIARESTRLWCAAVNGAQTTLDPQQMKEWTPNSRYGGHAFGFMPDPENRATRDTQFAKFLAARDEILPWIKEYSPFEHVSADDPPIYMTYSRPPALGEDQKDPTHTANFGVKLQERLHREGVESELVYPNAPEVHYPELHEYVIARLKR